LDTPVLEKVPIPFNTNCPIEKVKFFNAVAENGKQIWQEETKLLYPEVINGVKYISLWMDDFCQCINFDFKIDPECYDVDSTQLFYVNNTIKQLSAELKGMNSVYMPRKINDSTHKVIYLKDKSSDAVLTFSLYKGKKRIRGFKDKPITAFPYDASSDKYILTTDTKSFLFQKTKVWDMVLKVNGDRYRVPEEKGRFDFTHLKYKEDSVLIDFSVIGPKGRIVDYANLPLESLHYDEAKGCYIINRELIKTFTIKTIYAVR
jgi:hypothetical protein